MTTYTQARDLLVAELNTAWAATYPSVPIFYENTLSVDLDTVGDMFVKVSIDFEDAFQSDIDLDPVPGHQVEGAMTLTMFLKEGRGSRSVYQVFDFVANNLTLRPLVNSVHLGVPSPGRKMSKDGWVTHEFFVPFSFYSRF